MSNRGNPNGYPTRDWSTEDGARALASIIRRYWRARGRDVKVTVREEGNPGHVDASVLWSVRSDMVHGLPPVVVKVVKAVRA
jgi:hypothetical protein